ncbi:MAG: hypothetical protein HY791_23165 [Deltaproteobacteria bacterium]|nr:hypothetical protein [Deltaproteobacteria bacterium]
MKAGPTVHLSAYGVELSVNLPDRESLAELVLALPPELASISAPSRPVSAHTIDVVPGDDWLRHLERELGKSLASRSAEFVFLHAGLVAFRGHGILIPGRSWAGKSVLVEAFIRAGASYYSDEFAVFGRDGLARSFARRLCVRSPFGNRRWIDVPRVVGPPIPISLILATRFVAGARWKPAIKRGAFAVLPVIDSAMVGRLAPERVLSLAAKLAKSAVGLEGPRPNASYLASWTLDVLDRALDSGPEDFVEELEATVCRKLETKESPEDGAAICFVHLGPSAPPPHLLDAIDQARIHNPRSPIFVVVEDGNVPILTALLESIDHDGVTVVGTSTLKVTAEHRLFQETQGFEQEFRSGFWRYSSERFFVLEELMISLGLEELFHAESDVMLYCSLTRQRDSFRQAGEMVVPKDSPDRVIPSLVYIGRRAVLKELNQLISSVANLAANDMRTLGRFSNEHPDRVGLLPLVPPELGQRSLGYELFQSVFDAAAIGQFLGGIDPRNTTELDTTGFINETAEYSCADLDFQWTFVAGNRVPVCRPKSRPQDQWTQINTLHVHAKNLHRFSSRVWLDKSELVTGERLQALAEAHYDEETSFDRLDRARSIYVESDRLDSFFSEIWPKLSGSRYSLISHNGDLEVGARFGGILMDPKLELWLAQNALISHPKLVQAPIGFANSEWPHGDLDLAFEAISKLAKRRKTELLHLDFSLETHESRPQVSRIVREAFAGSPPRPNPPLPFETYLEVLSRHRFALCPRGNGIDTHRLWECLYLGVTPIVERSKHTEHWATLDLPILLVDDWSEVTRERLEAHVPQSSPPYASMLMSSYRRMLS